MIYLCLIAKKMKNTVQLKKSEDRSDIKIIEDEDISFIIQGNVNHEITPKTIQSIRKFFPKAEIVLSTYIGADVAGLDYDKIALIEDPGCYYYYDSEENDGREKPKEHNLNRQIQTTFAGLKTSSKKYAFKIRTDFILTGKEFLYFFDTFSEADQEYKIFEHKILSCAFFARNPRKEKPLSFHPSDIAFFGFREDLLKLFDVPLMTKDESLFYKEKEKTLPRYTPEQHIWVNCLLKNGKEINFKHQRDVNEKTASDTEKYTVSNFIYLEWEQFSLMPPNHLRAFTRNDFRDVITHIEWQQLYQRYLEPSLTVPSKDVTRDSINKKILHLKFYTFLAKLCTIFFFGGKSLQKLRKEKRKKLLQYFTRNIFFPK